MELQDLGKAREAELAKGRRDRCAHSLGNDKKFVDTERSRWEKLPAAARLRILGKRLRQAQAEGRRDNWALLQVSQYVLSVVDLRADRFTQYQRNPDKPSNFKVTRWCGTMRHVKGITAALLTSDTHTVVQSHLQKCGSVWVCPVCSSRIQAQRADEVQKGIEYALQQDWGVGMLTLTASHVREDTLLDVMDRFGAAWRSLQQSRPWRAAKGNLKGQIRSTELTLGSNGWHYHYHIILFFDKACPPDMDRLKEVWVDRLYKKGFVDNGVDAYRHTLEHSFNWDVLNAHHADNISRYVNKMSLEGTMSTTKVARGKEHRSPFGILMDLVTTDSKDSVAFNEDLQRYAEYALATKGRKQIFWSRGLKKECGIEDLSDEELVEAKKEKAQVLWGLRDEHWAALRLTGLTGTYMREVASQADIDVTQAWFTANFPSLHKIVSAEEAEKDYAEQNYKDYLARTEGHMDMQPDSEEAEAMDADREVGELVHHARMARQGDRTAEAWLIKQDNLRNVPF